MQNQNITKVDSKGRILIPVNFRSSMNIEEGTEMIIVPDKDNNHFKIMPLAKGSTAELKLLMHSSPGCMSLIVDALSANACSILLSESRRIGEELTEWKLLVDMPHRNNGVETLQDVISNLEGVKDLKIIRK